VEQLEFLMVHKCGNLATLNIPAFALCVVLSIL